MWHITSQSPTSAINVMCRHLQLTTILWAPCPARRALLLPSAGTYYQSMSPAHGVLSSKPTIHRYRSIGQTYGRTDRRSLNPVPHNMQAVSLMAVKRFSSINNNSSFLTHTNKLTNQKQAIWTNWQWCNYGQVPVANKLAEMKSTTATGVWPFHCCNVLYRATTFRGL